MTTKEQSKKKDVIDDGDDHEGRVTALKQVASDRQNGTIWVARTVTRAILGGGKEELMADVEEDPIEVGVFQTDPARAHIQKGLTLNLGNYESARTDVGVTLPCYVEEIEEALDFCNDAVERRLQAEVLDIRGKDVRPGKEEKRKK